MKMAIALCVDTLGVEKCSGSDDHSQPKPPPPAGNIGLPSLLCSSLISNLATRSKSIKTKFPCSVVSLVRRGNQPGWNIFGKQQRADLAYRRGPNAAYASFTIWTFSCT